jgi:serine/threonine protein kinase
LILEFVEGGNLHEFLAHFGPLTQALQRTFFIQAARAINYLHTLPTPILHGGIKSLNFLVKDKSRLLLTDLGLSKAAALVTTQALVNWSAPEVLSTSPIWTEKADIYSLGMVFFEIISREFPSKRKEHIVYNYKHFEGNST